MNTHYLKFPILGRAAFSAVLLTFPLLSQSVGPLVYEAKPELQRQKQARKVALPSLKAVLAPPMEYRLSPLTGEELRPKVQKMAGLAGVHRPLKEEAMRIASWTTLDDGRKVWRLALQSPDANGIRVHFRKFDVGEGRVWLHDGSGRDNEIMGPYTRKGPDDSGDFWSDFVLSDKIIVEFEPAGTISTADPLPFEISEIAHLFPRAVPGASIERGPEPQAGVLNPNASTLSAMNDFAPYAAASCNLDVSCYTDWAETARAVAHIVYEEEGHTFVCSGTLVNTKNGSGIPYFLTADHCISNEASARTVQVFWSYQTTRCNGPAASRRDATRTLGARYLVSGGLDKGDFSLIRLNEIPSGVVFSGWTAETVPEGTNLTGIHHPSGDYKRISFSTRVQTGRQLPGANPAYYYTVRQSRGVTEGGSSGSGLFAAPGVLVGMLSSGPKVDSPEQICQIAQPPANYGQFATAYPALRDFLEDRTAVPQPPNNGNPPNNPAGGGAVLSPGTPQNFAVEPLTSPTLIVGQLGFRVNVPQGATRLEIRMSAPGAQVGMGVRFGTDVALESGRIVADHLTEQASASETIVITSASNPALRAGTYYIGLAVFTTGAPVRGTITATVTGGGGGNGNNPAGNERRLASGQPRTLPISAVSSPTLFGGSNALEIEVPQGATRLEVKLATSPADVDIDLFVRYGSAPAVVNGSVAADITSEGPNGNETIVITPSGTPALRAGTYYIALGIFTAGRDAQVTLTATVTGGTSNPDNGSNGSGTRLQPGSPHRIQIPAVSNPTLFSGARGFTVVVPQGASRLNVRLNTTPAEADLDLFVRFGAAPEVVAGRIQADYQATGATGNETISITSASGPPLRPGTYHIALGVFTTGVPVEAAITAEVDGGSSPDPGGSAGPAVLTSGSPKTFNLSAVNGATLLNGSGSYVIDVPQGAQRLEIRLSTSTPGVDIDLFARHGSDNAVANGRVVADFASDGPTGNEVITISAGSTPALKPGRYFISLAMFTTGAPATGTVTATVVGSDPQPSQPGGSDVRPDAPVKFQLPAVGQPTLFTGQHLYRVNVPQGATKLQINVQSDASSVDVDLYVRHGSEVAIDNGAAVADHASESESGNERIIITPASSPALRPGTYYIALALFSTGVNASGTILVSIEGGNGNGGGTVSGARPLTLGEPVTFTVPAVDQPMLFSGENGFRVTVPEGGGRLEVVLKAANPAHDIDLYVRHGAEVTLAEGRPVADHRSASDTGEEQIVIDGRSSPPLRPGVYFIGIGQFSRGVSVPATLVARLVRTSPFSDSPALQKQSADEHLNRLEPKAGVPVALVMPADAKHTLEQKAAAQSDAAPIAKKASQSLTLRQN